MSKILFDSNAIEVLDVNSHSRLIDDILLGRLRYPKIKKLSGVFYQGVEVFRAKIDDKARLIYCYVPHQGKKTLLVIGVLEDHNYDKLRRQLKGLEHYDAARENDYDQIILDDEKTVPLAPPAVTTPLSSITISHALDFVPVVSYNKKYLELDMWQQAALTLTTPAFVVGPPGAGKTAVLFHLMQRSLERLPPLADKNKPVKVLFVSPAKNLLSTLETAYAELPINDEVAVQFTTWEVMLQRHYMDRKPVSADVFRTWMKEYFPEMPCNMVHYELSLLVALGEERYKSLGQRQSYFSGKKTEQELLIKTLGLWLSYLEAHQLFDCMVSMLPEMDERPLIFCDETQNLPPVALRCLIGNAKEHHFMASLDSEQCLLTSPFIHNCIKELLYQRYKDYSEHHLPRTWRCPRAIATVANHLMNAKYQRAGKEQRRSYSVIESALPAEGLISAVTTEHLKKLKVYGQRPGTVVIVGHPPSDEERALINAQLGSNNILTAAEAIGLDFDVVILWKPLSQSSIASLKNSQNPISLEEWNGLNALYVSLTRAQSAVFIYEPAHKPLKKLEDELFGDISRDKTQIDLRQSSAEENKEHWDAQIKIHLDNQRPDLARQLMKFHLEMSDAEIDKRLTPSAPASQKAREAKFESVNTRATPLPVIRNVPPRAASAKVTPSKAAPDNKTALVKSSGSSKPVVAARPPVISMDSISKEKAQELKQTLYIRGLLLNPSEGNIRKLVAHKNYLSLLFQKLENGSCLFIYAMEMNLWRDIIWDSLLDEKNQALLPSYITPKFLSSRSQNNRTAILFFLACKKGAEVLSRLLKDPEYTRMIDFELLNNVFCGQDTKNYRTYLLVTLKDEYNVQSFNSILINHPLLAYKLDPVVFCEPDDLPLFQLLAYSDEGINALIILAEIHPILLKKISSKLLVPLSTGMIIYSLFLLLIESAKGCELLFTLFRENPALIKQINAEILFRSNWKNEKFSFNSAFWGLSSCVEGCNVILMLFKHNPNLISQIDFNTLCQESVDGSMPSIFHFLASSSPGSIILRYIFKQKPDFALQVNAQLLYTPLNNTYQHSIFFLLTTTYEGREFLLMLLNANPEVAKNIPMMALCSVIDNEVYCNTSALKELLQSNLGRQILLSLLKVNPGLALSLSPQSLNNLSKERKEDDALYWLVDTPDGVTARAVLATLYEQNPELLSDQVNQVAVAKDRFFSASIPLEEPSETQIEDLVSASSPGR